MSTTTSGEEGGGGSRESARMKVEQEVSLTYSISSVGAIPEMMKRYLEEEIGQVIGRCSGSTSII